MKELIRVLESIKDFIQIVVIGQKIPWLEIMKQSGVLFSIIGFIWSFFQDGSIKEGLGGAILGAIVGALGSVVLIQSFRYLIMLIGFTLAIGLFLGSILIVFSVIAFLFKK